MSDRNEKPPLLQLAEAALYIDDLARGVQGEFIIEEEGIGNPGPTIREIHECQVHLFQEGWRRHKAAERVYQAGFSHNVEVAVYAKRFPGQKKPHFIQINLTTRFGVRAVFIGKR